MLATPQEIDSFTRQSAWFKPYLDDPPYTLLKALVEQPPNDESAWNSALDQILKPIEDAYRTGDKPNDPKVAASCESQLWEFWFSILQLGKRFDYIQHAQIHENIIRVIRAVHARPSPHCPQINELRDNWIWASEPFWQSLTLLGPAVRECFNDQPSDTDGPIAISAWTNMQALLARITKEDLAAFHLYALWAIRQCLEENVPAKELEARLPPAAAWLCILGQKLGEREVDWTPTSPNQGRPGKGGSLWKGPDKLNGERLALWKRQLDKISTTEGLSAELIAVAKKARSSF